MANNQLDINKWIKKNVIGLLAIIVSIIAIVITLKYNQPITTDWLGVLVGVLSLLVVALIGWNIYSLMDFNKIKEDAKEFNESIELRFKKLDTDIKLESTTTSIAIARMITERTKGAVNVGLKQICTDLGIDGVDTYTFRHSWATIAQNKCGASTELVAFCLNHTSAHKVTEGYIEKDFTPIDKLNNKVLDYIFQRGEYKKKEAD